jgi:TonB family protein
MKLAILLLAFFVRAQAQTGNARETLRELAAKASATDSWRVTGRVQTTLLANRHRTNLDLVIEASQTGSHLRYEIPGGPKAGALICDGGQEQGNIVSPGNCPATATGWESLTDGLLSARFDGSEQVLFEGREQPCDRIVAEYSALRGLVPGAPNTLWTGDFTRTLCVDRKRMLVLRDRVEGAMVGGNAPSMRIDQTRSFVRIERGAAIDPEIFRPGLRIPFAPEPPIVREIPPAGQTEPQLISRKEPEYTAEARAVKYQGTVTLTVLVGTDGIPREPRIVGGLPYGLDSKAIEAICDWRFLPATRDGRRIPQRAEVEVAFRLTAE